MSNYNHACHLPESIEAILNQSLKPTEFIIIDDASTDNSIDILKRYEKQEPSIRLIRNKRNMGAPYNAGVLLKMASCNYFYGASADDKVLPGLFEKSMALLHDHPKAGLCCSDPATFDGHSSIFSENRLHLSPLPQYFSPDDLVKAIRRKQAWIAGHTSLIKSSAMLEAGGYLSELRWHSDWFANLVVGFRHGICYIPEPLATIRVLPNSYSASGRNDWFEQREVLTHILSLLKTPRYHDVLPFFKRSGILFSAFENEIIRAAYINKKNWDYLPNLLNKYIQNKFFKILSSVTPTPFKRLYHHYKKFLFA
ncbi:glycosyltransferase [Thermodesulfobacteriota bacterium]